MRIKSYFADSVQDAIERARVELGPDAMLMNSKSTDSELRALGSVEVVFALPGQTAISKPRLQVKTEGANAEAPGSPASPADETPAAPNGEVAQQLADLRRQIETVKRSLSRQHRTASIPDQPSSHSVENICARLLAADISEDIAQEIAEAVELQAFAWKQSARGPRNFEMIPSEAIEVALAAELEQRLKVSTELGVPGGTQKIVMFVGPSGAGKTTSLIKLGLRCGLQTRLPMHILSLDTLRVGGWEHLAAYSRIAGLGFDPVHNLTAFEQLLSLHIDKKLILIDTPGFGPADMEDLNDLDRWLRRFPELDVHLVTPATLRPSSATRLFERFSALRPAKLLLTRADEADSMGVLVDLAMRSGLPLSYISNGQTIPEDIEPASKKTLLACLVERRQISAKKEAAA